MQPRGPPQTARARAAQLEFLVLSDKTGRPEFAARAEGAVLTVHHNNPDRVGRAGPAAHADLHPYQ